MNLVARLMIEDHQRLDGLFELAARTSGKVDLEPFGTFREGLFRHIGIEEDVLFLALSGRPGAPDEHIAKLRLDHSALRKLLVCAPSAELLIALLMIIEPHIRLEEEAGGFYDACDLLSASEVDARLPDGLAAVLFGYAAGSRGRPARHAARRVRLGAMLGLQDRVQAVAAGRT